MGSFSRSWEITKLSFRVMKQDKELFLFPIVGGIFSIIFLVALVWPVFLTSMFDSQKASSVGIYYLFIFIAYFGIAMIATFFNVCAVYTVKTRFEGKNATFWDSIRFAFSRFHLVVAWGLVSATVGLILRILDQIGENMGEIGQIMMSIITSILGAVWSFISAFVIPGMVYKNIGPFKALKLSVHTLNKTWGESLVREFGLGLIEFLFLVLGIVLTIVLAIVLSPLGAGVVYTILALGIIYVVAVVTFFSVATTVYNTALFVYADTGKIPHGYNAEVLSGAFKSKRKHAGY